MGRAVNVIGSPSQMGFDEGEIVMLTGRTGSPVMITGVLDTGLLDVQGSEEVRMQATSSPDAG